MHLVTHPGSNSAGDVINVLMSFGLSNIFSFSTGMLMRIVTSFISINYQLLIFMVLHSIIVNQWANIIWPNFQICFICSRTNNVKVMWQLCQFSLMKSSNIHSNELLQAHELAGKSFLAWKIPKKSQVGKWY